MVSPGFITPDGNGQNDQLTLRWTASEPISGTVRLLDRGRRGPLALADRHGVPLVDDLEWARGPAARSSSTAGTGCASTGSTVPAIRIVREATGPRRPDDPVGGLDGRDPSSRGPGSPARRFQLIRRRAGVRRGLPRNTLVRTIWANRATTQRDARPGLGRQDGGRRVGRPGTYRLVVTATSWIGTTAVARIVTVGPR